GPDVAQNRPDTGACSKRSARTRESLVAHPRLNPSSAEVRFGKLEVSFGTYRGLRTDDCEAGSNLSRPDLRHYFRLADITAHNAAGDRASRRWSGALNRWAETSALHPHA